MLKLWDFTKNKLCHRYFDNNLQKIFRTSILENGTGQILLIVVLMVGLWLNLFFFLTGFSFTDTDDSQDNRRREEIIFYSTLPLPQAHEYLDIYFQLCMWDDYHIFLIAQLVFTRLLLDEIYHLIELPFDWLMMWCQSSLDYLVILNLSFYYSNLRRETGGLELASTINHPCITSEPTNPMY